MREHLYNRPLPPSSRIGRPYLHYYHALPVLLLQFLYLISLLNQLPSRNPIKKTVDCKEDNVPGIDEGAEDHGLNRQLVKNYR